MRWLTGVLAAACLLAGCGGSSGPHLVTKPGHHDTRFLTACASADCGPNVIVLYWSNINFPGTTGYNLFANGTQVGTAASSPFTFSGLDCNTAFTLGVQAHDGTGGLSQLFTTPYTSPACPVAPGNTALPVVSGATTQGSVLSTTNGTWTGSPTSFAYQWRDCNSSGVACVNIAGATSSAYTLQAADVGDTVRVVVTASNTFGSTPATSAQTAVVTTGVGGAAPVNTAAPYFCGSISPSLAANAGATGGCSVLTQNAVQGQTLSVGTGTWTNSPTSFTYAWEDCATTGGQPPTTAGCGSPIAGATSSTYTVQAADVGKALVPVVTAFNGATASTATTVAGTTCNKGSTTFALDSGNGPQLNGDPAIAATCSPISAVVGTTAGTGAGAMKFCTNSPITCGYGDPLSGNAGVPPGTTLTASSASTCSGTLNGIYDTTQIVVPSGTCTITNSRLVGGNPVVDNGGSVTLSHVDIAGQYTGQSNVTTGTGEMTNISGACTYTANAAQGGSDNTQDIQATGAASGSGFAADHTYARCADEPFQYAGALNTDYAIADECWGPCDGGSTTHNEAIYTSGVGAATWQNSVLINIWANSTGSVFNDTCSSVISAQSSMAVADTNTGNGAWGINNCTTNLNDKLQNSRVSRLFLASATCGFAGESAKMTWSGNIWDDDASAISSC